MTILGLDPSHTPSHPAHFDIERLIRPNILALQPYRCARDDYTSGILLDANENALGHTIPPSSSSSLSSLALNRYPDPAQRSIKSLFAQFRDLVGEDGRGRDECVFLGVGSDEVIDLLIRVCVAPGREAIMITPPTYGMYAVCAQVNDVEVIRVPLDVEGGAFKLRLDAMKKTIDTHPTLKLIFLCSPGNPTGTLIPLSTIQSLLDYPNFHGILVVDEAYIDFAPDPQSASAVNLLKGKEGKGGYANLCVLQTLSKSFGLAGIRLGLALTHPSLSQILTNTKAPYNISSPTSQLALRALSPSSLSLLSSNLSTLRANRAHLLQRLASVRFGRVGVGRPLGGNHANFVLIPVLSKDTSETDGEGEGERKPDNGRAERVYKELAEREGVVVRFRGREVGCEGCLRITVGSEAENEFLLERLERVLERV